MQAYRGSLSLREALGLYFEENDFGAVALLIWLVSAL